MVMADARLEYRAPLFPDNLFGHLVATAVPGVEEWRDGAYRRTLRLARGPAIAALAPCDGHVAARLWLTDARDRDEAIGRCRFALDLDADPRAIDAALAGDPLLAPLVAAAPGRRVPHTTDPAEMALRAVLGQQVSTAAARTHTARLVVAAGEPVADPEGGLTHLFPTPAAVAAADPGVLAMPESRRRTLRTLASALADGAGAGEVGAVPGIGPWTEGTIAMRALGDPDAFVATDLGVRAAAQALGLPATPAALSARAERWRPYRAYAVQHLWAVGDHPINVMPA
jgi:AraC family transcriptional regulator of adaptative response / DNA-3-methyladenine glycosylase II